MADEWMDGLLPAWGPRDGKGMRVSFKVAHRRDVGWGPEGGSVGKTFAVRM